MLSSVIGIYANPSQSNYSAGCVFQVTLARSRSLQEKTACLLRHL